MAAACALLMALCKYPYDPQVEPPIMKTVDGNDDATRVFPINGRQQICNPSISRDTVHFPGCMLLLNFSGVLAITAPAGMSGFSGWSAQHDRLTIVDTSNTVRWFMKREELGADEREEFQDPEWAAHPAYIVCLLSAGALRKWSCYAIHPRTRKRILLCKETLGENSTPHLWVGGGAAAPEEPSAVIYDENGFADSASVFSFFGTSQVKVAVAVASGRDLSLYYRDYAGDDRLVPLARPDDRAGWRCESPLISPDGGWVAFNAWKTPALYESYIQELSATSRPILLKEGWSDPHWWAHPADSSLLYLVYQEVPGDNLVYGDLADPSLRLTGELGVTYRQLVHLFTGASTQSASLSRIGQPEALVKLPTKGGLSPDGRYLCTGYDRAFIVGLP